MALRAVYPFCPISLLSRSLKTYIAVQMINRPILTLYVQNFNNLDNSVTLYKSTLKTNVGSKNENAECFDAAKAKLILQMNFRNAKDALPFYKLPIKTLVHIYHTTNNDNKQNNCSNRLYYIANRIKYSPSDLSEHMAKRTFVYSLSFEWIARSLDMLLEMGVSGDRIIRDLWVLKYHHETIHDRLQWVKDMGIETLYPWMVRCNKEILNRYIAISQETKNILGESKSTQVYLANRLNTSPEAIEDMCSRIPALKRIRVTKVKHFLDFLIEEGFNTKDIISKPRVLSASPTTVKQRLEKLRKHGLTEINLNVLCRSRKHFKKYCDSIELIEPKIID